MIVSPTIVLILFLSSVAFAITLFLGIYVLKTNPGNVVNRLYFLITLFLLPWCLGEMFMITALDNEFEIYYQPVFELNNKNVLWVEAILRWHRPERGIISAETFMSVAEQSGLSIPIGEWMLQTACRDMRGWKNSGFSYIPLAVSIPSKQFMQPNFVENVEKTLNEKDLEPRNLKIEINESMVTSNIDRSVDFINSLHKLDVQFVLSEFGTGYSSLIWFKLLPIKIIKLSPLFIKNIQSDPYDITIVKSIIMMANTLGIQVVAEGIENKEQLDFLKSLEEGTIPPIKCDGVQGHFLCEPMKSEDILRFLLRHSS